MGARHFILKISDLEVRYGFRAAVDGVSLDLRHGECLGLLGVNGAGKTSTLAAILGMLQPRRGDIAVFGGRPGTPAAFRRTGFAPEDGVPPEYLSSEEYLSFVAGLKIRERADRRRQVSKLLELFDLPPRKKIREFSKGMKKRIVLAQAFLGKPDLLILDEPLNGLDPLIIIKLRDLIDQHIKRGAAIVYSSHILTEVEKSCTRLSLLKEGKQIYTAPVEQTVKEFGSVEAAFAAKAAETEN
jgi:ABC-2 type transport system ATP-binding protein